MSIRGFFKSFWFRLWLIILVPFVLTFLGFLLFYKSHLHQVLKPISLFFFLNVSLSGFQSWFCFKFLRYPLNVFLNKASKINDHGDLREKPVLPSLILDNAHMRLAQNFSTLFENLNALVLLVKKYESFNLAQFFSLSGAFALEVDKLNLLWQTLNKALVETQKFSNDFLSELTSLQEMLKLRNVDVVALQALNEQEKNNLFLILQEFTSVLSKTEVLAKDAHILNEVNADIGEAQVILEDVRTSFSSAKTNLETFKSNFLTIKQNANNVLNGLNNSINNSASIKQTFYEPVAESLKNLEQDALQISNLLQIINEIIAKTNLLSLNASIIAAQSGDEGRGFGVVAEEIKVLSQRTSSSIGEIALLINNIQEKTHRVESLLEFSLKNLLDNLQVKELSLKDVEATMNLASEGVNMVNTLEPKIEQRLINVGQAHTSFAKIQQGLQEFNEDMHSYKLDHLKDEVIALQGSLVNIEGLSKEELNLANKLVGEFAEIATKLQEVQLMSNQKFKQLAAATEVREELLNCLEQHRQNTQVFTGLWPTCQDNLLALVDFVKRFKT